MMLSDDRLSVRRLSVAYTGLKLRRERSRKTKIGTEVAHITYDTTFKVKGQGHQAALVGCTGRPTWTST